MHSFSTTWLEAVGLAFIVFEPTLLSRYSVINLMLL